MEEAKLRIFSIKPGFRRLYLPYPPEQRRKLRDEILSNGYSKPFMTWSGVLLTDFDAYEICFNHDIPMIEKKVGYPEKEIAYVEMCKYQMANHPYLTESMRRYLIGKRFLLEKKLGKEQAKKNKDRIPPKRPYTPKYNYEESAIQVRERLSKEFHVSKQTIYKYGIFAESLDKTAGADDDFFFKVVSEQLKISIDTLSVIASQPLRMRRESVKALLNGKNTYSSSRKELRELKKKTVEMEDIEMQCTINTVPSANNKIGSIKNMPAYDPDSELKSLFYTVPSWSSSIKRVKEKSDLSVASNDAKTKLRKELIYLLNLISDFLLEMEE